MPKLNRKEFLEALRFVAPAVPDKTPTPVLQYALLDTFDGKGYLIATDNEVRVGCKIKADGEIKCLVPVSKLIDLLSACRDEEFNISLTTGGIKIVDSSGSYTLLTPPIDEFPTVKRETAVTCKTDSVYLGRAFPLVMACINEKFAGKYILNGMRFQSDGNSVLVLGTDTKRLCSCKICDGHLEPFTLPIKTVRLVQKMDGAISIGCKDGLATFISEDKYITSRTLDGSFPEFKFLFDKSAEQPTWSVNVGELENSLRKASIYSGVDSRGVKLVINNLNTQVLASGADSGKCGIEIKGGCEKQGTTRVDGKALYEFVTKIPSSARVIARIGEMVAFTVGDFCQFSMATMEVI